MHPSTLKYCRSFWEPSVSENRSYDEWKNHGGLDIRQKANTMFHQILENSPDMIIEKNISADLEKYVAHVKTNP